MLFIYLTLDVQK